MKARLTSIAAGGDAVGRDETGRAVFVPYGAPGDIAEVAIVEEHRSFARGRLIRLESASPTRVKPPCLYYRPDEPTTSCGGCQLQHLDYQAQLQAKRQIVADAFRRIAGLQEEVVKPCIPSPAEFGYRNKAEFVVELRAGQPVTGYYAPASHTPVDIGHCLLVQDANNSILKAARACINEGLVQAYDAANGQGVLLRLTARTGADGACLLIATTTDSPWPEAKGFAEAMMLKAPFLMGVLSQGPRGGARLLAGQGWLEEHVAGIEMRVSGESFFQVNSALVETLVNVALGFAGDLNGQRALDVYCGAGLFSLTLARAGARVTGIESSRSAVRDARHNAKLNGLPVEFREGRAAAELAKCKASTYDLVLLDPPRAGAAECVEHLARIAPARIVYISCDPATLSRDIKALGLKDYRLTEAVPLDMFPQTAHVETVACLELTTSQ